MSRIGCGIISAVLALISWFIFWWLSEVLALISWFVFWWLSIVSIVIGVVGLLLNLGVDETNTKNRVLVGTILNAIGIILATVGMIIFPVIVT